ncbi:hypothetical protein NKX15_09660 [Streptococcus suis]|uniref:hypothetical protein n=1 Tax=Streptococcus suis TaxID=1307 RepID=UPI0020C4A67F|nr:hypothetical protein [Streptococcus suis]MCP8649127.1 hypothetical protein [Streptococcus suis]
MPKNWLAENPQPLAVGRLAVQSAERERISEINWNLYNTSGKLTFLHVCLKSEPKSIFDFGFFFWAVICHIQQTVQLVEEGGIIRLVAE